MRSPIVLAALALALPACETTNEDEWSGSGIKVFSQAERTCQTQTDGISDEAALPAFFVGCMRAFGWTPLPGSPYADPASAPDPT